MAQIQLERKRGKAGLLWVVLVIVLLALVAWYLLQNGLIGSRTTTSVLGSVQELLASAPAIDIATEV